MWGWGPHESKTYVNLQTFDPHRSPQIGRRVLYISDIAPTIYTTSFINKTIAIIEKMWYIY